MENPHPTTRTKIISASRMVLAALAISLGTIASKACPIPWLAPLLFATGILLVIQWDLLLITRYVPTQGFWNKKMPQILIVNLLVAYAFGLCFPQFTAPETPNLLLLFVQAIGAGAMIGLVSLINVPLRMDDGEKIPRKYTNITTMLLMYIFVMLGMPHCVVYAFLNAEFLPLLIISLGNIAGGILIRTARELLRLGNSSL